MSEQQDWNIPGPLMNSMYATFASGLDRYEMYQALSIPSKYADAVSAMWDAWELERENDPLPEGVVADIPSEFPDIS